MWCPPFATPTHHSPTRYPKLMPIRAALLMRLRLVFDLPPYIRGMAWKDTPHTPTSPLTHMRPPNRTYTTRSSPTTRGTKGEEGQHLQIRGPTAGRSGTPTKGPRTSNTRGQHTLGMHTWGRKKRGEGCVQEKRAASGEQGSSLHTHICAHTCTHNNQKRGSSRFSDLRNVDTKRKTRGRTKGNMALPTRLPMP